MNDDKINSDKMNEVLLFKLLEIASPSGCEDDMKAFLISHLQDLGISPVDLGPAGLSWEIGEGEQLAFVTAHSDQVGFVVSRIDEEGYIFVEMPGIDPRVSVSSEITVWGKRSLRGVVGMLPPHFSSPSQRNEPVPADKLFIDVGLPPDLVRELVAVGTRCTWSAKPARLAGSRITGAGLDNRISLFEALILTRELRSSKLPGVLRFFATSQEEGMMFGAGAASRAAAAEGEDVSFALVLETTFAAAPQVSDFAFQMGTGPILGVGPILSRPHLTFLREVADDLSLTCALEPLIRSTGTEADVISIIDVGIPCILVSIPIRNMHTPVEVADLADVEASRKLLSAALIREELWKI